MRLILQLGESGISIDSIIYDIKFVDKSSTQLTTINEDGQLDYINSCIATFNRLNGFTL